MAVVANVDFRGGWGIKLAKTYDSGTDTLTVFVHSQVPRGPKGDRGPTGATGATGATGSTGPASFGRFQIIAGNPAETATDPASPTAGDAFLKTLGTGEAGIWDGSAWWRLSATTGGLFVKDAGGGGSGGAGYDLVYQDLFGETDLAEEYGDPIVCEFFG